MSTRYRNALLGWVGFVALVAVLLLLLMPADAVAVLVVLVPASLVVTLLSEYVRGRRHVNA